jgi:enamine deaminase RidA (YjgF/YER057c/UK114 family)
MLGIGYEAILPEGWERPRGYAHAVIASGSRVLKISGQLGKRPERAGVGRDDDFASQWRLAMENLVSILKASGAEPAHVVMLRAYVVDIAAFKSNGAAVAEAWKATFGRHFPAMTLVQISALIDPNALVEIEAEAILP